MQSRCQQFLYLMVVDCSAGIDSTVMGRLENPTHKHDCCAAAHVGVRLAAHGLSVNLPPLCGSASHTASVRTRQ